MHDSEWFDAGCKSLPWWSIPAKKFLQFNEIPKHLAFVMDGNRRYARRHNFDSVIQGHSRGFEQMTKVLEWCQELGVREVTLYAFSIENFKRDEAEVSGLMQMAENKFQRLLNEKEKLEEKRICFRFFGDMTLLSKKMQTLIAKIELQTRDYKRGFVNFCLAYTSKNEISRAMEWIQHGYRIGLVHESDIDETLINKCLDSRNSYDVDMLIRTSGEHRLSDFMLWQCSNCYIHFDDVLWPDIGFWHLFKAILCYQHSRESIKKIDELTRSVEISKNSNQNDRIPRFLNWMEEEILKQKKALFS